MSDALSGRGDPLATLRLLWGVAPAGKRGPKAKLDVARLVSVAVAITDREGLGALTTRRVADELGISPMSLYTYVPSMYELVDLMIDAVVAETPRPRGRTWRAKLEEVAHQNWQLAMRHPWLLEVVTHRGVLGPQSIMKWDRDLSAVDGIGLTEMEMDRILTTVLDYVWGAVRNAARETLVKQQTGMSDGEWWTKVSPLLAELYTSEFVARTPVASRVGPVVGEAYGAHDPRGAFAFGLACVLDGIEQYIAKRGATTRRPAGRKPRKR